MNKTCLLIILTLSINFLFAQNGLISYDVGPSYEGYTLFPAQDKVYLIDNCGKLIHQWNCGNTASLATYLMEDGNLLFMSKLNANNTFVGGGGGGGRLEIYSPTNNLQWQYDYHIPDVHCVHHDVEPLPNGNILAISWVNISVITALVEGRDPNTIGNKLWVDKIIEIQPVGTNSANIVWEWNMMDHLVQDFDATKNNYGVVADNPQLINFNAGGGGLDWSHFNGIDYHETFDQILISSRHLNEIYVIDHSTTTAEAAGHTGGNYGKGGDILYRYGNPQNYNRGTTADRVLFNQHDARWIENGYSNIGNVSIFNNGVGRPPVSSGTSYSSVDVISVPVNSSGVYINLAPGQSYPPSAPAMEYNLGPSGSFFSGNQGGAEILPNGNVLVCNANSTNFFEIDANNTQIYWEYDSPIPPSTFKINRYTPNYPGLQFFDLTPGNTIESPSSPVSNACQVQYNCNLAVNFSGLPIVTSSNSPIALVGSPFGGTFSGTGVVFSAFNPSIAGPGTHTVTYTYTDQNNCTASASQDILVFVIIYNFVSYNLGIVAPKTGDLQTEIPVEYDGKYNVEVLSIDGRKLFEQKIELQNFQFNQNLKLPQLINGTYLLHIFNEKRQLTVEKFVVGNSN